MSKARPREEFDCLRTGNTERFRHSFVLSGMRLLAKALFRPCITRKFCFGQAVAVDFKSKREMHTPCLRLLFSTEQWYQIKRFNCARYVCTCPRHSMRRLTKLDGRERNTRSLTTLLKSKVTYEQTHSYRAVVTSEAQIHFLCRA